MPQIRALMMDSSGLAASGGSAQERMNQMALLTGSVHNAVDIV